MAEKLIFASGNLEKFHLAQTACKPYGVELIQMLSGLDEIQSEDPEMVIRDKTHRAYQKFKRPLIVSDDSWSIPALHGFPGPYMKSVNLWFKASDWLHLMEPYEDRRVVLAQLLAFHDEHGIRVFRSELPGTFLPEARGTYGSPAHKVITMQGDHGLSIAEVYDQGVNHDERDVNATWTKFLTWYTAKSGATV